MAKSSENKAEVLILSKEVKPIFDKALKKATGEPYFLHNDSVFVNEVEGNTFKVVIYPTNITFLFNLFRFYGELYLLENS